jgi:hypothetical protein
LERDGGGREDECKHKPIKSFAKAHAEFQTVKLFFYAHNIDNILNMERALFGPIHNVSAKK